MLLDAIVHNPTLLSISASMCSQYKKSEMKHILLLPELLSYAMATQTADFIIAQDDLTGEQAKQVLIEVLKYQKYQLAKKGLEAENIPHD
jgi:hypothetical protein